MDSVEQVMKDEIAELVQKRLGVMRPWTIPTQMDRIEAKLDVLLGLEVRARLLSSGGKG